MTNAPGISLVSNSRDDGITLAVTVPVGALPVTVVGVLDGGTDVDFTATVAETGEVVLANARLGSTYLFQAQAQNADGVRSAGAFLSVDTGEVTLAYGQKIS